MGIQQAIGGDSVLSAAYVGTRNRHQNYYTQTNLPSESLLPEFVTNNAAAQTYNANVPYVGYSSVLMGQNGANGDYSSLQVAIRGTTLKTNLTYQVGYTYSHGNDSYGFAASGGDLSGASNPYEGWKYDYGPSGLDIRNIFFTNFVYDIPLFKNSAQRLRKIALGGWEISGVVTAKTGAPLNIWFSGYSVTNIVPGTANRPNRSGKMMDPHTVQKWFDTSVFSAPAPGTWGNTPHNGVRGPGRDNWNVSLFKNFLLSSERGTNLQFRAEFFNIWNHPQWVGDTLNGGIIIDFNAGNFGAVTSAYDPRTIQLALKFSF
jgi:hypothetical protein